MCPTGHGAEASSPSGHRTFTHGSCSIKSWHKNTSFQALKQPMKRVQGMVQGDKLKPISIGHFFSSSSLFSIRFSSSRWKLAFSSRNRISCSLVVCTHGGTGTPYHPGRGMEQLHTVIQKYWVAAKVAVNWSWGANLNIIFSSHSTQEPRFRSEALAFHPPFSPPWQ
jgi:hypothetical protein